jgi:hypothetical protein
MITNEPRAAGRFREFKLPVFEMHPTLRKIEHFARVFDLRRLDMLIKR